MTRRTAAVGERMLPTAASVATDRWPTAWGPVRDGVLATIDSSTPTSQLFDDEGKQVLPDDGKRTAIDSIDVATTSCSWNAEYLVCAADKEWGVWRFAV